MYSRLHPVLLKSVGDKVKKIENRLILKQDETIGEFLQITRDRNKLLKFLLWTNVITLLSLSLTLGYFL